MSTVWQDCRFALRSFASSWSSTAIAMITLAIAIGLNTAVYSVVRRQLLEPLPFPNSERLDDIEMATAGSRGVERFGQMPTFGAYEAWRERSTAFEELAAYTLANPVLRSDGRPERVSVAGVESRLMLLIGARPSLGRLFAPEEDVPSDEPPVILSGSFWTSHFGQDSSIIGRILVLDGRPHRVIGVMPDRFLFPVLPPDVGFTKAQLWTPLASLLPADAVERKGSAVWVIGRTRPGISPAVAQADLDRISEQERLFAANDAWHLAQVTPVRQFAVGGVQKPLLLMLGAAIFVLLVACANVASLLLARGVSRQRELTVRAALGASRGRIVRQLVTESVLLTLIAGVAGLALATWGTPFLARLAGTELPDLGRVGVDLNAVAAALAATTVAGIMFGLLPGVRANDSSSLVPRSGSRGGGRSRSHKRLSEGLVVAEIALTMVLLAGAGILIHSFLRLVRVDLGFEPKHVLAAGLTLPSDRYGSSSEQLAFASAALRSARAIGGVSAASVSTSSPMVGGSFSVVRLPGTETRLGSGPAWLVAAMGDYFRVLNIPVIRGQSFDEGAPNSVLIDGTAAKEFFAGVDPLGKTLAWRSDRSRGTVIGVVGSVRQDSPRKEPPHIYMPLSSGVSRRLQVLVRTAGEPERYAPALRRAILDVDPTLVVDRVTPMSDLLSASYARQRFYMILLGTFAGCALLVAVGGIYATVSVVATGTVRELAIRAALGAQRRDLFALVMRRGLLLTIAGCIVGMIGAFATTKLLAGLLFEVNPVDPYTFAAVFGLLCLASLAASYLPGRRAMRADPIDALNAE